jgi:ankyrin repeat protein
LKKKKDRIFELVQNGDFLAFKAIVNSESFDSADLLGSESSSVLHIAASLGNLEILSYLLDEKQNLVPSIDIRDSSGKTPLHDASISGQFKAAQFLLDHGSNVNALDRFNRNPMYYACWRNHIELAQYLHSKGGMLDIRDTDGFTIYESAQEWGHESILEFISVKL